eukprot:CAMPEP_0182839284 /NCGR_PEP_ID=MMETSP0006_2-20121128/23782_1 /TAXON_ID=97485 /ORGANISM="Prymnesium parvum, Strain Texoma1" /LENGTH=45 /DNA_ID= /DNA_START= /DNA_END= /DNA_ORIENTATION=
MQHWDDVAGGPMSREINQRVAFFFPDERLRKDFPFDGEADEVRSD